MGWICNMDLETRNAYMKLLGSYFRMRPLGSCTTSGNIILQHSATVSNWYTNSSQIKNAWSCASTPTYTFMALSIIKHQIYHSHTYTKT